MLARFRAVIDAGIGIGVWIGIAVLVVLGAWTLLTWIDRGLRWLKWR